MICLLMTGCGHEPVLPTPEPVPDVTETIADWTEILEDYIKKTKLKPETNAVLYIEGDIIVEAEVLEGEYINIPNKTGYNFEGFVTSENDKYVDSKGMFTRTYNGNNILLLKASFIPQEFEVSFFKKNERIRDLFQFTCAYDQDLSEDLHIGDVINQNECIFGWKDSEDNLVVKCGDEDVYIADLAECVDYSKNTVDLYIDAVMTSFYWQRLTHYDITENGFLNQTLNNAGEKNDCLDFSVYTDLKKLKELGYSTVHLKIECDVKATFGKQYINILSDWPEDEKELKEYVLFESGNIDLANKEGKAETYVKEVDIPLASIGEKIYIAYNAGGSITEDSWKSQVIAITVTFEK